MAHGVSFVILPYYVPYVSERSKGSPRQCYTSVCDSYYCWQHAVYISAYSVLVDTIQASPYTLSYNVHGKIIMYTHAHTHTCNRRKKRVDVHSGIQFRHPLLTVPGRHWLLLSCVGGAVLWRVRSATVGRLQITSHVLFIAS